MSVAYHIRMEVNVNERAREALLTRLNYRDACTVVLGLFARALTGVQAAKQEREGVRAAGLSTGDYDDTIAQAEKVVDALAVVMANSREPMNFDNTEIITHPFAGMRQSESVALGDVLLDKLRHGVALDVEDLQQITLVSNVDSE